VYGIAGENIARNNYPDAQAESVAMTGFMNSPGHKANIMGAYRFIGTAWVMGADGAGYVSVEFAG
jgi:uncharacterized protein YkwD